MSATRSTSWRDAAEIDPKLREQLSSLVNQIGCVNYNKVAQTQDATTTATASRPRWTASTPTTR